MSNPAYLPTGLCLEFTSMACAVRSSSSTSASERVGLGHFAFFALLLRENLHPLGSFSR